MCEEIKMTMRRHRQSLGYSKEDLNRLNKAIQLLTVDVNRAESQELMTPRADELFRLQGWQNERPCKLEGALQEEDASGSVKGKLAWLETALKRARQAMVWQLQEYQELMIVKLGLDFEIATYHKLLEGEKRRVSLRGEAESLRAGSDAPETSTPGHSGPLCGSSVYVGEFGCRDFPGC